MSIRVFLTNKEFPDLPLMSLKDTGVITAKFKIVGSRMSDDETMDESEVSYDLDCEITKLEVKKVNLTEATERALGDQIRVKTQVSPFPG